MRVNLLGYFDLGGSYGLDDGVFKARPVYDDLFKDGLRNPIGIGEEFQLHKDVVKIWIEGAVEHVTRIRPDHFHFTPLIGDDPKNALDAFKDKLIDHLRHCLETVDIRVYGLGIGLACLRFRELPDDFVTAVCYCFEFAGYESKLARPLLESVCREVEQKLRPDWEPAWKLTERPRQPDVDRQGRDNYRIFSWFSRVGICVGQKDNPVQALKAVFPGCNPWDKEHLYPFRFEDHGTLYYDRRDQQGFVIAPPARLQDEKECQDAIARMISCVHISHALLGVCEAFEWLFLLRSREQAGEFLRQELASREAQDLNRLRTTALAVVGLTDFTLIVPTREDQDFFRQFQADNGVAERRAAIQTRCEVLHGVQEDATQRQQAERDRQQAERDRQQAERDRQQAERDRQQETQDREQADRDRRLNRLVIFLTGLTLISVLADSYGFIKDDKHLFPGNGLLWEHTGEFIRFGAVFSVALSLIAATVAYGFPASRRPIRGTALVVLISIVLLLLGLPWPAAGALFLLGLMIVGGLEIAYRWG